MSEFREESRRHDLRIPENTSDNSTQENENDQPQEGRKENYKNPNSAKLLNRKILKIKRIIKDRFPELSKFLDEMPVSMEDSNMSEVSYNDLDEYYQSLEAVLTKYKLEYPNR